MLKQCKKFLCSVIISLFIISLLFQVSAIQTDSIPHLSVNDTNPQLKNPVTTQSNDIFSIPSKFSKISSLSELSSDIQYFLPEEPIESLIGDNYTSTPVGIPEIPRPEFRLTGWSGVNLDWIDIIQPSGSFIVSKNPAGTSSIQITIPSGTTEKGLLLYSQTQVPENHPEIQINFRGTVTENDALIVVMKETDPPYDYIIGALKPGSYDGFVHLSITEFAGKDVAIILGAYYTTPDNQQWTISDFKFKGGEKNPPEIRSIAPAEGKTGQTVPISLEGSGFQTGEHISLVQEGQEAISTDIIELASPHQVNTTVSIPSQTQPGLYHLRINRGTEQYDSDTTFEITRAEPVNIEKISPAIIINNNHIANITITGQNFQPDTHVMLIHPEYGEIRPLNYDILSSSEMYAVFPVRDVTPGEWNIIIRNEKTGVGKESGTLSIISPGTPIISEISPNIGNNAEDSSTTTVKVDNFVGNGYIFLTRTGYTPIYAKNINIPSSGTITCKIPVTGEPTGNWNLTVRNPNGNQHTLIDGYTIIGEKIHPYDYVSEWNLTTKTFGGISRPGSLWISDNDTLVITDVAKPRFFIFNPDGTIIQNKNLAHNNTGAIQYPADITIANSGTIYIIDKWKGRVEKYTPNGEYLTGWGSYGVNPGEFQYPSGICVNDQEEIYVTDTNNHRIQKFDADGKILKIWGDQGSQDGQFNYPTGIIVNETGMIYVVDSGNDRIQRFNSDGRFQGKWGDSGTENGYFLAPADITSDPFGFIYTTDIYQYQVQKFNHLGEFETKWGVQGDGQGEFTYPGSVAVNSSGYVFVLDDLKARIQIFKPEDM